MKHRYWWVKFREDVYAMDKRFEKPVSERYWRKWVREFWGYDRLPRGTQVWGYE